VFSEANTNFLKTVTRTVTKILE